jgi:DNA modification methylase
VWDLSADENTLCYGDNLDVLRALRSECVDLIYLDPPFNSQRNYNLVFKDHTTAGPKRAFHDVWRWDDAAENAYRELTAPTFTGPSALPEIIRSLFRFFGPDRRDDMAYPAMMAVRLVELHRVLKSTGSLYLHCDPTASHYLRLILDAVFGGDRFQNEIIWKRTTAHSSAKKWAPVHDVLLYYTKSNTSVWNSPRTAYDPAYLDKYYKFDDGDGRLYWRDNLCAAGTRNGRSGVPWRGIDPAAKGMHWKYTVEKLDELDKDGRIYWPQRGTMPQYKRYREELKGKAVSDIWDDIDRINPVGSERIGFPTQKPLALLTRIIETSSNKGDVVLDPFCGCGTAIEAALTLERTWFGIDIADVAVDIIAKRLARVATNEKYRLVGFPSDVESAQRLARTNPHGFQWWVLTKIRARQVAPSRGGRRNRKGGDRGIDGELFVRDFDNDRLQRAIISVKAGANLNPSMLRDLIGTVATESADLGILVTMAPPTDGMRKVAREAGTIPSSLHADGCPKFQIITVAEIFAGKQPALPGRNVTEEAAPARHAVQPMLPGIAGVDPSAASRAGRVASKASSKQSTLAVMAPGSRRPTLRHEGTDVAERPRRQRAKK